MESARWQVISGRPDLALKGLRKVARVNGRKEEGDKLSEEVMGGCLGPPQIPLIYPLDPPKFLSYIPAQCCRSLPDPPRSQEITQIPPERPPSPLDLPCSSLLRLDPPQTLSIPPRYFQPPPLDPSQTSPDHLDPPILCPCYGSPTPLHPSRSPPIPLVPLLDPSDPT